MSAPAPVRPIAKVRAEDAPVGAVARLSVPSRLDSRSLFKGARLVVIEHEGSEYRLQITGRGKLILTR